MERASNRLPRRGGRRHTSSEPNRDQDPIPASGVIAARKEYVVSWPALTLGRADASDYVGVEAHTTWSATEKKVIWMSTEARAQPQATLGRDMVGQQDMVQRALADPRAFREIYQAYLPRVYRFATARTRSTQDAEDVTSATFEKALRALHSYDRRGPFDAWLFRIALNCLRDHARQARLRDHEALPAEPEWVAGDSTEAQALDHVAAEDLRRQVRGLPAAQAEVLTMMTLADLRPHEVARALGKREGTVRYLLHRALRTLKERQPHD